MTIVHDPSLVILSITIAVLGCFTACVVTSNLASSASTERKLRLIMATLALGGSAWATHFVGLLSIQSTLNWTYQPVLVLASALIMIFGTAIAFFLLQEHVSNRGVSLPLAVAVLGTALVASHYTGIGALTGRGLQLSWFLAAINIFVSIEVAVLFFWFVFRQRGVILTLAGSIALGFALAATHYLSIASTENLEAALASVPAAVTPISDRYLAWTATIMMYLICSICLCVFVIMQFREEME